MNTQIKKTPNASATHSSLTNPSPESEGNWFAILTVAITAFALVTSEFLPIGVLNSIAQDLDISVGTAGLVITLPGIMGAIAAPVLSVAVKQLDRRKLLIALTAIMVISNFITGIADSFALLLFSRFLLGIAIGGFWATAIALSGRVAPFSYSQSDGNRHGGCHIGNHLRCSTWDMAQ